MQKELSEEIGKYPTSIREEFICGKKYIVVSVYSGIKDFKKVYGEIVYRQTLAELQNKTNQ